MVKRKTMESINSEDRNSPTSIRVAYQSLEMYKNAQISAQAPQKFTKKGAKTDQIRHKKGETVAVHREGMQETSVTVSTESQKLPSISNIISHIIAQSALIGEKVGRTPDIIVLGECGPKLIDNVDNVHGYQRIFLFEGNNKSLAIEQMTAFVVNKHIGKVKGFKVEAERPGFGINVGEINMCFVHILK